MQVVFFISIILLFPILRIVAQSFFSPLNRFPGPRLAKWTSWYRGYYDLVKRGEWLKQLQVLHDLYGPIVRVGPNELHFSDPRAYSEIYSPGSRFHKDPVLYSIFSAFPSVFTTLNPQDAALIRTGLLAPYLSRRAIIQREGVVREKILKLISILKTFNGHSGKVANLNLVLPSASVDVLTSFLFTRSFNVLDTSTFDHPFVLRVKPLQLNLWIMKYLPSIHTPILGAFTRFMLFINPEAENINEQIKFIKEDLNSVLKTLNVDGPLDVLNGEKFNAPDASTDVPLYHFLLQKSKDISGKPSTSVDALNRLQHFLQQDQLVNEGINLRFAGTDSVANACLVGMRYLLSPSPKHKNIAEKLVKELDEAWPEDGDISYEELEKLPYLTAVIKESLRLSHGVVTPLGRVVGPGDAVIMGENIPIGTTVGISSTFVHMNPKVFPAPEEFNPERWLKVMSNPEASDSPALELDPEVNSDKYLVSFSRGPRSCIGIHLAWCELYLTFGLLFRKLEFVPVADQDPDGPLHFRDFLTPIYEDDPLSVFVKERPY